MTEGVIITLFFRSKTELGQADFYTGSQLGRGSAGTGTLVHETPGSSTSILSISQGPSLCLPPSSFLLVAQELLEGPHCVPCSTCTVQTAPNTRSTGQQQLAQGHITTKWQVRI